MMMNINSVRPLVSFGGHSHRRRRPLWMRVDLHFGTLDVGTTDNNNLNKLKSRDIKFMVYSSIAPIHWLWILKPWPNCPSTAITIVIVLDSDWIPYSLHGQQQKFSAHNTIRMYGRRRRRGNNKGRVDGTSNDLAAGVCWASVNRTNLFSHLRNSIKSFPDSPAPPVCYK